MTIEEKRDKITWGEFLKCERYNVLSYAPIYRGLQACAKYFPIPKVILQ